MPPKLVDPKIRDPRGSTIKYTEEYMREKADDLLEWSKQEDSIVFAKWLSGHEQTYEWSWEMCDRYPFFSKAFKAAKLAVGARREEQAYKGEANTTIVAKTMHNYDPSLLKTEKEIRKADKDGEKQDIVVKIEK